MSRGISEKIFFPIRKDYEEYDRELVEHYISALKDGKENKGVSFYTQEGKLGENKGVFIVMMEIILESHG